jgi:hypothetical protein
MSVFSSSTIVRYTTRYAEASKVVTLGVLIKFFALVIAVLSAVAAIPAMLLSSAAFALALWVTLCALTVFLVGVLFSTLGFMLSTSIDCAVCGSPFLDESDKAELLSLQRFPPSYNMPQSETD